MMPLKNRLMAEFVGTFWLVLAGCGCAVMTAGIVPGGVGILGVGFAFGIAVMSMAFAVGHISGGHFNPAVTIGLATGKRFPWSDVGAYIVVQVAGAIAGAAVLYVINSGKDIGDFACTGYGDHSPGKYSLAAGLITEIVFTCVFLIIIQGATDRRAPAGFAPIAIGIGLVIIVIVGVPVTNLSVNPARSSGTALFRGGWALQQLWMFWVAPIIGGFLGGVIYPMIVGEQSKA